MKKLFLLALFFIFCLSSFTMHSQNAYWVFFTDKQGATFDPYAYFDAKAIERYNVCGADLYDITNYPVSALYEQGVGALATEEIGASRWMNALGIMATPEQISAIEALPYVLRVQPIDGTGLQLTRAIKQSNNQAIEPLDNYSSREPLFDLQEGRFVSAPTETTLSPDLSALLHQYLSSFHSLSLPLTPFHSSLDDRTALINALLNYYHLHLSGFSHFHSHEILHTILK